MKFPKGLIFLFPFWVLLAGGCATSQSALMVPVRPSPMHSLKPVPPAKLRIPLVVSLPPLNEMEKHLTEFMKEDLKKAEKSLTKSLGSTLWWDPLTWDASGNTLSAHLKLHYQKGAAVPSSQGAALLKDLQKDMKVDIASVLQWSKDWHLEAPGFLDTSSKDRPNPSASAPADPDQTQGEKLLIKGTDSYHQALSSSTDLKDKAKELWASIQEPIQVNKDIWLQIIPERVSVGACHFVFDTLKPRLETVFEIFAKPNLVFGQKPQTAKSDLPPLKDYQPGPDGFHVQSNLKISFEELNKLLTDPQMGILDQPLPGSSDKSIKITGLKLYGSGGRVVVQAQVEYQPLMNLSAKPAKLTVYLLGTPEYHEDKQTIDFPDLDFDVKSSDFLVQMATFIDGDGMKEQLRQAAVIPVGKNMEELKEYMMKMLNRPLGQYASLKTTVDSFKMEEAFVSDYGIEGRVSLDGDAVVDVNW
jgi:hypothetical protein